MNDMTLYWLMMGLIFVMTIILLVLFKKRTRFEIFPDLIMAHDFAYPANIPNYAIKSITLIEKMPKVLMRSNCYGGLKTWKGIFRISGGKRAILYLEDHNKGPIIKIETVRENIYINYKNKELTNQFFDEMTKTIKILPETELADCKLVSTSRSWTIVGVFIAITLLVTLIPLL
ncbi:MAG: hypothetical protein J6X10_04510 [Bacteroidales bacterium]|nr:hypothetical protein [Bacteroidales bacterium]